ncbi:DUF4294 domain-containing protein [Mesonia sp. MT50]|uniref:DUF4294 domain-containing protein n=1 Tax=Mesonia profundi TaxID=3070998 RepID=A0ABU0ZXF2_9FLAO|nr:DUF4294 domain-containing protein [Mesonia profundi]MDQ7916148.1 DUF4294 domain-containing protein [Mesonia profundi]
MLKHLAILYIFLLSFVLQAQQKNRVFLNDTSKERVLVTSPGLYMIKDDSLAVEAVNLDEVLLLGPFKFKSRAERRTYLILHRKTKKVWPYAVLASERLTELNERLNSIESKHKKKKYTKIVQKYIEDEFSEELKKLTKTEGQILVKLMYRQTGETTFEVIKELRSGWNAFWYNTTASLFNISLKETYDPLHVREDYYIEHILRRGFQKNELDRSEPAIAIDFSASMKRWN